MNSSDVHESELGESFHRHQHFMLGLYLLLGYISTQLHELGHWSMATASGASFILGFNRWQIVSATDSGQSVAILAAGPLTTLVLIAAGLAVAHLAHESMVRWMGLAVALFNSWFALFPQILALLFGGMGDEGWISYYLGVPQYVIRLPVVAVLVAAMFVGFRMLMLEVTTNKWIIGGLFVTPLFITGLIVLLDRLVWLDYGEGVLLLPLFGISAVTVVVNISLLALTFVLFWRATRQGDYD